MKKSFLFYMIAWSVAFALFHISTFVIPPISPYEKYTVSFWVGYALITVTFIGQAICSYKVFKANSAQKIFYRLSLIGCSYVGLVFSLICGGVCMIVPAFPYWLGILFCALALVLQGVAVIKAVMAVAEVERIDSQVKTRTTFIKTLAADADNLMVMAKSEDVRAECEKVYDAIRYSDPMSTEELRPVENEINEEFEKFSKAVKADDADVVKTISDKLLRLVKERSGRCKLLK